MAKELSKSGISTGADILAGHVTQSVDALTGTEAYDITISGSLEVTGSITGTPGTTNNLTSSYAITASHAEDAISSSYAITASHALNSGGGPAFPFTGSAIISGSLEVQGDFNPHPANLSSNNIGIGLVNNDLTGGSFNVFMGNEAGRYGSLPQNNVAIGRNAGYALGTGQNNVFVGYRAGYANGTTGASYTPNDNTAVGAYALDNMLSGDYNVALGYRAGDAVTGAGNLMIGYEAGASLSSGDGNIFIGSGSLGADTPSNQLRIGNGNSLVTISASLATGDLIFANDVTVGGDLNVTGTGIASSNVAVGTTIDTGISLKVDAAGPDDQIAAVLKGRSTSATDYGLLVQNSSATNILMVKNSGVVEVTGTTTLDAVTNDSTVAATKLTGSFSGSFVGDGSQLTNLPGGGGSVGTLQQVTDSGSVTTNAITSSALYVLNGTNISPNGDGVGQLQIHGAGYTSYLTMDSSSAYLGHNSLVRDFSFQTNEITRLTLLQNGNISASGDIQALSFTGVAGTTNNLTSSYAITASHALNASLPIKNFANSTQFISTDATGLLFEAAGNATVGFNSGTKKVTYTVGDAFPFTGSALITGSLGVTGSISTDSNITINEGGYFRTFDTTTSQETLRVGQAGTTAGGELIISDNNGAAKIVLSITEGYINNGKDFGIGTNSPTSKLHVVSPTSSSLLVEGSGSTIFDVQGSQGQLFSVTDDLLDEVFSVSDISGDPLLTVSGSGLIRMTNLPSSEPSITGSLWISGSSPNHPNSGYLMIFNP